MSALSIAATVVVAVVGVSLATAAVLPAQYELSRSRIIAAPAPALSALVADFSRRTEWIPWAVTEPTADFRSTGTPGAVGSRFSWIGKAIGEGSTTLAQYRPGELVEATVTFERPMRMASRDRVTFESLGDGTTRVTWSNTGTLPYPLGRLFGLVIDRVVGADYAAGLARLETAVAVPTSLATQ